MKKSNKMNGLYKASFIILWVCVGCIAAALIFGYLLEKSLYSMLFGAGGCVLALVGIILGWCAKPKKENPDA